MPTDEGHESDPMFEFDGSSTAVVVPEGLVSHYPGDNFTVSLTTHYITHHSCLCVLMHSGETGSDRVNLGEAYQINK